MREGSSERELPGEQQKSIYDLLRKYKEKIRKRGSSSPDAILSVEIADLEDRILAHPDREVIKEHNRVLNRTGVEHDQEDLPSEEIEAMLRTINEGMNAPEKNSREVVMKTIAAYREGIEQIIERAQSLLDRVSSEKRAEEFRFFLDEKIKLFESVPETRQDDTVESYAIELEQYKILFRDIADIEIDLVRITSGSEKNPLQ